MSNLNKRKISSLDKGEKAKTQHPIKLRLPLLESEDTPLKFFMIAFGSPDQYQTQCFLLYTFY